MGLLARTLGARATLHHAGLRLLRVAVLPNSNNKQRSTLRYDQEAFGFAALWDSSIDADGVTVQSCTIAAMPANQLMTEIHNVKHRMPAILTKEDHQAWLTGSSEQDCETKQMGHSHGGR